MFYAVKSYRYFHGLLRTLEARADLLKLRLT